jgi:hypothetical protein
MIAFAFLTLFPAASKSITDHSTVTAKLKIHRTVLLKALTFTPKTARY